MADIELWHNPRCSKSRAALKLLEDAGVTPNVRRYLDTPPTPAEISDLLVKLDKPAIALVRTGEPEFKAAGLTKDVSEQTLIEAMAHFPKLIERPVAIRGNKAVIGRPPEDVLTLL